MSVDRRERQGAVVLVGCGRLGSAILEGWLATDAVDPSTLIILTPSEKPIAEIARSRGARLNPPRDALADAVTVVLAVKPGKWREAISSIAGRIASDATIVSVMAGVTAGSIGEAFQTQAIVRVMPTTAVAQQQGVAAVWSNDAAARATAHTLFAPLAEIVDLDAESQIDIATAVAGSGPAYVHAFTRALAQAGQSAGLDSISALRLARGAIRSAAAASPDESLDTLIARVASPGGTTEAGLKALNGNGALAHAVEAAVTAALNRARDLSRDQPT